MNQTFLRDVHEGLSASPKTLPSRYFYDEKGDALFVEIMALDEYYLTRAEMEIFSRKTEELVDSLDMAKDSYFELAELGAGDGQKTRHLLHYLAESGYDFSYLPIDISQNALQGITASLSAEMPSLSIKPLQGDYFDVLNKLKSPDVPKVVLFLGSNIGNMPDARAGRFVKELSKTLSEGDRFLLGVDLIKDASVVLPAYDDKKGVTKAFNLNVLNRINMELGGNFDLSLFEHVVTYTKKEGIVRSYLRSKVRQQVLIEANGEIYSFEPGESIHTEISRKYDDKLIEEIFADTPFRQTRKITDSNGYFADYLFLKD